MALRTKTGLILSALLMTGVALWYFTMQKWAARYQKANASWRIQGFCINAQDGTPVQGAQISAYFVEPVTFAHHLRNLPIKKMDITEKTDEQGRFELIGKGSDVILKVGAEGYRDIDPWEYWRHTAMKGVTHVETNIVLTLQPASESMQEEKSPEKQ
jgi:hypothetical protein